MVVVHLIMLELELEEQVDLLVELLVVMVMNPKLLVAEEEVMDLLDLMPDLLVV
jgi:hypothetical protein